MFVRKTRLQWGVESVLTEVRSLQLEHLTFGHRGGCDVTQMFLFKHCRSKCDFNSCSLKVPGAAEQPWPMCNWICTHACMHTCSHIWNAHPQACTVYTLIQAHECTGMNTHACTHACINSALSPKRHMAFSVCSQSDLMRKRLCSRKFCWTSPKTKDLFPCSLNDMIF